MRDNGRRSHKEENIIKTVSALFISTILVGWAFLRNPISTNAASRPAVQGEGVLSGTITDQQSGLPILNIDVQFWQGQGHGDVHTDDQGQYQVSLPAGEYRIAFFSEKGDYFLEWFDNAASVDTATPVQVTSGGNTVVNTQLEKAGVIKGSVLLDVSILSNFSIDLQAYDALGTPIVGGWDFLSGRTTYQLGNLHTGTYKIGISYQTTGPNTYSNGSFYYDLNLTFPEADNVNVITGATTSLDIDLTNLGQICGTVTDFFSIHPAPFLFVVEGLNDAGNAIAETETDASGHYCLSHLAPGNYAVLFTGGVWPENCPFFCQPNQLYQEQQYPDVLALARGQVISGIDGIVVADRFFMPLVIK